MISRDNAINILLKEGCKENIILHSIKVED